MKSKIDFGFRALLSLFVAALITSCNLYSKFGSVGSDETKIEEALKCLHDGDYDCAIANYSALSDATQKARRLCQVQLARAGLTLSVLINTLGKNSASADVLGSVANAVIPWTQEKETAIAALEVKTGSAYSGPCDTFYQADTTSQYAQTLFTLSGIMSCAVRMAKADQLVGNSDSDVACATAGNLSSKVTAEDISDNADGSIAAKGMCSADAVLCKDRFLEVSKATGGDAEISQALNQLSSLTGASDAQAIRALLRSKTGS
jgi:hypothetical protein